MKLQKLFRNILFGCMFFFVAMATVPSAGYRVQASSMGEIPPSGNITTTPTSEPSSEVSDAQTNAATVAQQVPAADLSNKQNPKLSGTLDNTLSIKTVAMVADTSGQKDLSLTGNAAPNSKVTLYIFSNDPIVITISVDDNGNWNYELNKD